MRDILPAEKSFREQLLAIVRATYISRGFQEIETPALEDLSKLTSGQGGDNEKLVFQVLKRGEELRSGRYGVRSVLKKDAIGSFCSATLT